MRPKALVDDPVDDLVDLLVDHGLAARDVDDRGAGLLGHPQALLDLHPLVEHVLVLADPTTPVTREVADLEGLEHERHREALLTLDEALLDEVRGHAELECAGSIGHFGSAPCDGPAVRVTRLYSSVPLQVPPDSRAFRRGPVSSCGRR